MSSIESLIKSMSLEEKVGQFFQIGFMGTYVTEDIKKMIEENFIGGIIYFNRNIESIQQLADLSNQLQNIAISNSSGLPLFISTDQEGGIVNRLKGATHFPGQMAIAATQSVELAKTVAKASARQLKAAGLNMNFAPVLDINNNPDNPVIGTRSFGGTPQLVAELATAYISGMQSEGIIACGKHFPGHGDTDTDSHLSLPVINHSLERLQEVELYPFIEAIKSGLECIMTAHIYFPAIEKREGIPATLSHSVLTGLLRRKLNYKNLIITDCMEMKAIIDTFGTVEASVMAIEAGSDMVLISHSVDKVSESIRAVIKAVQQGRISENRINKSLERILKLKNKRITEPLINNSDFKIESGNKLASQVAEKSVTLVKDELDLLPVNNDAKILVCDFEMGRVTMVENNITQQNLLVDNFNKEGLQAEYYTSCDKGCEIPDIAKYDLIIVCTYNAVANSEQVDFIEKLLKQSEKVLVLSIRNPYDINVSPDIKAFMTIYDNSPANFKAASKLIMGKIAAKGKLPIIL